MGARAKGSAFPISAVGMSCRQIDLRRAGRFGKGFLQIANKLDKIGLSLKSVTMATGEGKNGGAAQRPASRELDCSSK
jgi:hypothetical protein